MVERADDRHGNPVKPIDSTHSPLHVWLAVTRLSNLPTVFSNVLTGLALGFTASAMTFGLGAPLPADHVLLWQLIVGGGWLVLLAGACFYIAGMTLNDVLDRHHDRMHRPERPIPSGRLGTRPAVIAVISFSLIGVLLMLRFGLPTTLLALGLLGMMVAYNALHRRFAASVVCMGAVRGLLYLLAAAAVAPLLDATFWRIVLPFALLLTLYVTAVTYLAQHENKDVVGHRRLLVWALPVPVLAGVLSIVPTTLEMVALAIVVGVCVLLGAGWCARRYGTSPAATKQAVMGWLAGLCLIDAYFLALLGRPAFVGVALVCFAVTVVGQRRVMGT